MAAAPERRTAMYHAQLEMGAEMADADGWRLPLHFGSPDQESAWLKETVGVSDVSPIGKVRVVGEGAAAAVAQLVPNGGNQGVGTVIEADSPLDRGGKLLSVRLAPDEFLILTPTGVGALVVDALQHAATECAHAVDVTSTLCGIAIVGPATQELMSRITEVDTSPHALPDLTCVQSRFADVQALLLRRDASDTPIYQLYASREFGEYLWQTLVETAHEVRGSPVGTQALLKLRDKV